MLYWVYGFPVRSEIALPELREADAAQLRAAGDDIVEIRVDAVPETLPGETQLAPWLAHAGGRLLVTIPNIGRILVESGQRIFVDKTPGALESDLRTYLLGSGLGALLHQRGNIPLHVGALLSPAGAIAFTGPSGAGKSTAVATISQALGWPVISDDVAVLSFDGEKVRLEGGVHRMRLWKDALERLNKVNGGLVRDIHRHDKFLIYEDYLFVSGPQELTVLYELVPDMIHAEPKLIRGAERFSMVANAVYRPSIAGITQNIEILNSHITKVANQVKCVLGPRPSGRESFFTTF